MATRSKTHLFLAAETEFSFDIRRQLEKMPGNKRWYLEPTEHGIIAYRDGNEAYYKAREGNRLLGPITEVRDGADLSQARTFKEYAIEVTHMYYVVNCSNVTS